MTEKIAVASFPSMDRWLSTRRARKLSLKRACEQQSEDAEHHLRVVTQAFFDLLRTLDFLLRQVLLEAEAAGLLKLTDSERRLIDPYDHLFEDSGAAVRPARRPLEAQVRHTWRLIGRLLGKDSFEAMNTLPGYDDYRGAFDIRDRLEYPRIDDALDVASALQRVYRAAVWFEEVNDHLFLGVMIQGSDDDDGIVSDSLDESMVQGDGEG